MVRLIFELGFFLSFIVMLVSGASKDIFGTLIGGFLLLFIVIAYIGSLIEMNRDK